jgi:predicted lysophospholipase L1 biosynthesis ABC-type transport system permease subunit
MDQNDARSNLAHIRSLMERSTRFISLSGLSGVFAGVVALGGAWLAQHHVAGFMDARADDLTYGTVRYELMRGESLTMTLLLDALGVLALALLGAFWFTWRRSRRLGQGLWDPSARRLAWNLFIPLAAGGIVCLALLYHGLPGLVAPATLVFYGLGLLNASKYTLDEIRWLAISELVLGVLACFWVGAGLMFWALGFGVMHIVYGGLMWMRHERGQDKS